MTRERIQILLERFYTGRYLNIMGRDWVDRNLLKFISFLLSKLVGTGYRDK